MCCKNAVHVNVDINVNGTPIVESPEHHTTHGVTLTALISHSVGVLDEAQPF